MNPYTEATQIFGRPVSAKELIDRVGTYSWVGSLFAIAKLASLVAREGPQAETVRRATTDELLNLTGTNQSVIEEARRRVAANRNDIVIAHEEVLAFLAHTLGGHLKSGQSWTPQNRPV